MSKKKVVNKGYQFLFLLLGVIAASTFAFYYEKNDLVFLFVGIICSLGSYLSYKKAY